MLLRLWLQARAVYQAFVTGNDSALGPRLTKLLNTVNIVLRRRKKNIEAKDQSQASTSTSNQVDATNELNLRQTATYTITNKDGTPVKPTRPRTRLYIDPNEKT